MSTSSIAVEKSPRIAVYQISRETWLLCVLVLGCAASVRLLGGSKLNQLTDIALFIIAVVNTMNFLIPFVRPNTILGGARLQTLVLALTALVSMIAIH